MKKEIVFATNNEHKLKEVSEMLSKHFDVLSLSDIGCMADIPETAETLEGNALIKARYVFDKYKINCFSDDTGLEVEALNNAPGVYSARYAGEAKSAEANMLRLLSEMKNISNRNARFRTVIALIIDGKEHLFEGIVSGTITEEKQGQEGFGYDPIFKPDGFTQTFAELNLDKKNQISHRAKAVEKLVSFLEKQL
jgi:XTP/dITP diphosphohydrolase